MDDNNQLSKFQLFTVVISNKYKVLKFCPLVLDATVHDKWNYVTNTWLKYISFSYIYFQLIFRCSIFFKSQRINFV